MSFEKSRPRARRSSIEHEEERAWAGFYQHVGSDPVLRLNAGDLPKAFDLPTSESNLRTKADHDRSAVMG